MDDVQALYKKTLVIKHVLEKWFRNYAEEELRNSVKCVLYEEVLGEGESVNYVDHSSACIYQGGIATIEVIMFVAGMVFTLSILRDVCPLPLREIYDRQTVRCSEVILYSVAHLGGGEDE